MTGQSARETALTSAEYRRLRAYLHAHHRGEILTPEQVRHVALVVGIPRPKIDAMQPADPGRMGPEPFWVRTMLRPFASKDAAIGAGILLFLMNSALGDLPATRGRVPIALSLVLFVAGCALFGAVRWRDVKGYWYHP